MSEPHDPTNPEPSGSGSTAGGASQPGPGHQAGPEFRLPNGEAQPGQAPQHAPYAGSQPDPYSAQGDPYAAHAEQQGFAQGQPVADPSLGEGATAPQPPAPKKKHRLVNVLVTLLVIVGLAAAGRACAHSDMDNLAVGNCVKVTQKSNSDKDISADKADCTSNPSYKVVKQTTNKDGCGVNEDAYIQERKDGSDSDVRCLMPNMDQGKCYNDENPTSWPSLIGARLVDCSASDAEFRVSKVVDNSTDTSKCSSSEKPWTYNEDATKRVYCLVAAH